jgi:hypothetical protein
MQILVVCQDLIKMRTAEQTTIMASLAASVEPSGACTALHLWAMAGAGKTWKRGEGRAEAEQEGIYSI